MTERLYLHVGSPKSGTTWIQQVLETNRERLADAGTLLVGTHLDRVHAGMVVREDPRLENLPEEAAGAWQRLVDEILAWQGPSAILSYELFSSASADQVAARLADLAGVEVHVVITARDLGRAVSSAWQERLKFALTTPLEQWRPRPASDGHRIEWGWRTMDPDSVANRWGRDLPPEQVHIVTVPRDSGEEWRLWKRFAKACAIDVPELEQPAERANQSLGLVASELLRRVNEVVGDPISGNREHARWLRDTLAHRVLVHLEREPIGLTDEQYADAEERSDRIIRRLRRAKYPVHGNLEDIRATRRGERTPSQAGDDELLDAAVRTIAQLLLLVRERTLERDERAPLDDREPGLRGLGKGLVRRVAAPRVDRRRDELESRIRELEAELDRARALHLRVAELGDVVTELLLPAGQSEKRLTVKALHAYRAESL